MAMEFGKLDELLSRITREIKEKEDQLNRLILEVQLLKRQAKTLDDTRALLVGERSSNETYGAVLKREAKLSLQTEILRCFGGRRDRPLSVMEVVMLLRNRKYPGSDSKNFYVSVYTTLKRLGTKGMVSEFALESQRKAYRLSTTEQSETNPDWEET
jgi:hypothetical protein